MAGITQSIDHPGSIAIRLIARGGHQLLGSWTTYCTKGVTTDTSNGTYTGTGTAMAVLRLPFAHPDNCTVGGAGRLASLPSLKPNAPEVTLEIQLLSRH